MYDQRISSMKKLSKKGEGKPSGRRKKHPVPLVQLTVYISQQSLSFYSLNYIYINKKERLFLFSY